MPEKCSNCGAESMEDLIVTAMVMRTKKFEDVRIGICKNCGHFRSIASRGWFGL